MSRSSTFWRFQSFSDSIVEDQHHAGKTEERSGAQMFEVRDPVHHDLDRNGDLLFHLFGGPPGPLRDDLDVVVRDVRVRFDREIVKRDRSPDKEQKSERDNQKAAD